MMIIAGSRASGKTHYALNNLVDDETVVLVDNIELKKYIHSILPNADVQLKKYSKLINHLFFNKIKRVVIESFSLEKDFNLLSLKSMGFELVLILQTERAVETHNNEKIYISR